MTEPEEAIVLDKPDKPRKKNELLVIGIGSLGVLALGLIFQFMHWPGYLWFVIAGFTGMTLRYLILFFREPQSVSDWLYLGGRVAILLGFAAIYFFRSYSYLAFLPAMILFFLGIITAKRDPETSKEEKKE